MSTSAHQPISVPKIWHFSQLKKCCSVPQPQFSLYSCRHSLLHLSSLAALSASLLLYALPTHALSARTANIIKGTEPYLLLSDGVTKLTSLDELLGFSMPKRNGSLGTERIDASMAGTVLTAPLGMKYQDVVTLITADGQAHNLAGITVGDEDGDANLAENTSATGQMKATWYNGSKQVTDLTQTLSSCGGPYTLTIEIPTAVSANTTYGAPNTKPYGAHSGVSYTFTSNSLGICYLQPASMDINTGTVGIDISYANGYNSAVWEYDSATSVHKGFNANSGFPTTGFNKAVFSVIGSGSDQSKYRCSSADDGGKIILSGYASSRLGDKCTVTYSSATREEFTVGGTPTIKMEYNQGGTWVQIDSYTIPTPTLWARPVGKVQYNTETDFTGSYPAAQVCDPSFRRTGVAAKAAAGALFFTRAELTNSPAVTRDGMGGYFSRDVGNFTGEWGNVFNYSRSGWDNVGSYWTGEAYTHHQFGVVMNGGVGAGDPVSSSIVAVCR